MDNRITKARLKNHWHYSWWKYLVVICVCVFAVDMLFVTTAYRPPANKKIEMYLCNGYIDAAAMYEELWPALQEAAPDQEKLTLVNIDLSGGDVYSNMQFTTYIGAQQGDVVLIPAGTVKSLAPEAGDYTFADLTEYELSGALDANGIDLSAGRMISSDGEMGLYAVPADTLYGLLKYNCDPAGSMLCVMGYSGNVENAVKVINLMFDLYQTEKPEGYDEMRKAVEEQAAQSTQLYR